jgi:lamin tail-like protein
MLARYRLTVGLVAVGVTLGLTTPAIAATTPTISAPAYGLGFGDITITGTARAGATVTLIEAAYIFRSDLKPATDYGTGGTLTTTANSTGHYSIARTLDSGFVFAVEADGLRSKTIAVALRLLPTLTASSTSTGALTVGVDAGLSQPGLPVHIQRRGSTGAWTTLGTGFTDAGGGYSATFSGRTVGSAEHVRGYIEENPARPTGYADAADDVWSNWTDTVSLTIGGTGPQVRDHPTAYPAPPAGGSTPTRPTTPGPAPTGPKAGDVRFSKIQFDSAGRDTGSNTSLNGEWFRLTNRTGRTIDLKSWTVKDASGHTYTFGSYPVRAGRSTYVHTGRGTDGRPDGTHRYWGRGGYIWNNGGDTATLRSNTGKTIDSCRYTASHTGYTTC